MEREKQLKFDPNPMPKLDIQIIPKGFGVNFKKVTVTALLTSPLLAGCTPEQKFSMIGAGALATIFTVGSLISLRSDDDTRRKNQQRRIDRHQDGQIPNGVMAKHDYKQLRKKYPDASHDQLVAYIGEHGKSHLFDK